MVKDIRVTDEYAKRLVERIRQKSGEGTPTRTATRLIIERAAQLEREFGDGPDRTPPTPVPTAAAA